MPHPKRKHTRSRRDSRRSQNSKFELKSLSSCENCGSMRLPHRICPSCGSYKGKVEMPIKEAKKEDSAPQQQ